MQCMRVRPKVGASIANTHTSAILRVSQDTSVGRRIALSKGVSSLKRIASQALTNSSVEVPVAAVVSSLSTLGSTSSAGCSSSAGRPSCHNPPEQSPSSNRKRGVEVIDEVRRVDARLEAPPPVASPPVPATVPLPPGPGPPVPAPPVPALPPVSARAKRGLKRAESDQRAQDAIDRMRSSRNRRT